jgi:integrase
VFTTTGETPVSGFSRAKEAFDRAMGNLPPWTFHDLRRTVATGLQRLRTPLPTTEAVLNHRSGSRAGVVGVYQRHDYAEEKREALQTWGRFVLDLVEGRAADNLVDLRSAS